MSELRTLVDIISSGVDKIQSACDAKQARFPPLDEPFTPQSDAIRMEVFADAVPVIAAAQQLIATLQLPSVSALDGALCMAVSSAISVVLAGNIPEILREAGPQGLHVDDISAKCNTSSSKLECLLRLLATNHIFKEDSPQVFAHNRISSCLDTGNSVKDIVANPLDKYNGGVALPALASHLSDEGLKAAAFLKENLFDPKTAQSGEPTDTAFNTAFKTDLPFWEWIEQPQNVLRLKRFGVAMKGTVEMHNPKAVLDVPIWETLPSGSVVVDVGGGIGSTTMALADVHKHLRYIIQDREAVAKDGIEHWTLERPDALKGGLVTFRAHDFFQKQPVTKAAVYLLRIITHDWSDKYAEKILKEIRAAAGPDSKLILVDVMLQYACPSGNKYAHIPGAVLPSAPPPLLANFGIAKNIIDYYGDFIMMALFNGQERTFGHFVQLLSRAGWKAEQVYPTLPAEYSKLVASPI